MAKAVKIPHEIEEMVKLMASRGVMGCSVEEVARNLMMFGFHHAVHTEYLKKYIEGIEILRRDRTARKN